MDEVIHLMLLQPSAPVLADSAPRTEPRSEPRRKQPMAAEQPDNESSISADQVKP
jgi:hypothetical protein